MRVELHQLLLGSGPLMPLPRSPPGLSQLRRLGLVYFLYLFLFSGLEYTLSFLTHQRFQFSRWECGPYRDPTQGRPAPSPSPGPSLGTWGGQGLSASPLAPLGRAGALRFPFAQPAAGKDVFLHRPHHGHHPGHLCPAD